MKHLIFLVILGLGGSFAYKYFIGSPPQDSSFVEPTSYGTLPPLPQQCEDPGEALEDAIYSQGLGMITIIELNQYTHRFRSCLLAAGFTDSQVNKTYDRIEQIALSTDLDN